jgi:hypothetical protein
MPSRKNKQLAQAERALKRARLQLRTAAALRSFVLSGNDKMAAEMRSVLERRSPAEPVTADDLNRLADQFPHFARIATLLQIAGAAA